MSNGCTVRCPRCKQSTWLWEGVELSGWRSLEVDGKPTTGTLSMTDRDVYWDDATPDGYVGCGECQWEGVRADLERLDRHGELIRPIHPQQMRLT